MECDPWQSFNKLLKHNESTPIVNLNAMLQQYLVTRSCSVCVQGDLNAQLLNTQLRHYGHLFIAWLFPEISEVVKRGGLSTRICFVSDFVLYRSYSLSSMIPTQKEIKTARGYNVQRPNYTDAYLCLCLYSSNDLLFSYFNLFSLNQKLA